MHKSRIILILLAVVILPKAGLCKDIVTFQGNIDFLQNLLNLQIQAAPDLFLTKGTQGPQNPSVNELTDEAYQSLQFLIEKKSPKDYQAVIKLDHLRTSFFDLSSEIHSQIEMQDTQNLSGVELAGSLKSQYSLYNYHPLDELSGQFVIKDNIMSISHFQIGNVRCQGTVNLTYPFHMDLKWGIKSIGLDDFLAFWVHNKDFVSQGVVDGEIKSSGDFQQVHLKGSLNAVDGNIKKFQFDRMELNIEGQYPQMQIAESTISSSDGMSYSISGLIDLSDQINFKKQVKALDISPLVKKDASKSEWTIKRLQKDSETVTELKYQLRKQEGLGKSSAEQSDMLGVETSLQF